MTEAREYTQAQAREMYAFIERSSHLFWAVQDTEIMKESATHEAGTYDKIGNAKLWEIAVAQVTDEADALVRHIDSQSPDDAAGEGES